MSIEKFEAILKSNLRSECEHQNVRSLYVSYNDWFRVLSPTERYEFDRCTDRSTFRHFVEVTDMEGLEALANTNNMNLHLSKMRTPGAAELQIVRL